VLETYQALAHLALEEFEEIVSEATKNRSSKAI